MPTRLANDLVGRDAELAMMEKPPPLPGGVYLYGPAGIGKTALLEAAASKAAAGDATTLVLRLACDPSESGRPYAAIRQVVKPLLEAGFTEDEEQWTIIDDTLAGGSNAEITTLARWIAFGRLFATALEQVPIVAILDDLQYIDSPSEVLLTFIADHVGTNPRMWFLAGCVRDTPHEAASGRVQLLHVRPLTLAASARLLDRTFPGTRGRVRRQILEWSDGNPTALLANAAVLVGRSRPSSPEVWKALQSAFHWSAAVADLSAATRSLLLCTALADSRDALLRLAAPFDPNGETDRWAEGEAAGLVRIVHGVPAFTHPLVRTALLATSDPREQAQARREVAELYPPRSVEGLARALETEAVGDREEAIRTVTRAARSAESRLANEDASRLFEAAASFAPRPDSDELYVRAAQAADRAGDCDAVERLLGNRSATGDDHRSPGALTVMARSSSEQFDQSDAVDKMLAALEAAGPSTRDASTVAVSAAQIVLATSAPELRQALALAVGHWDRSGDADWLESSARKFARSVLDVESGSRQDPASVRDVGDLVLGGLDAWVSDAPRDACEFFELALYRVDVAQGAGLLRDMAVPYTLCLLHSGRAAEAEKIARESLEVAVIRGLRQLELQAAAVLSMLLSSQQRSEEAQAILDDALARNDTVNFDINRFSDVLLHQARSALLAARGDIDGAYAVAQAVFDPDGSPRHPWSAFQSLSVLTTLEARRGERGVALRLAGTLHAASGKVSEYAQFTLDRAQALFGAEEKAERYFDAVLSNPATDQWAVCAAIANADYGVWLRRKRRDREARDHLRAAKTFFERENMRQQAAWMTEELRAAGVGPGFGADQQNVLAGLSEHQREILRLAADGMRNSEIAERLYLSPHTVRSHLYRLYPKLGVTDRQQLRDLLATILDAAPASPPS